MRARLRSLRRRLGSAIIVGTFKNLSRLGSLLPASRPAAHGLEVLRDLAPAIARTAERASIATLDDLGAITLGADIAAMKHETQHSRVFRT